MIYNKVKDLCDKQGIPIMALEQKAGLSNGTINGWKGGSKPLAESLYKVAQVLNVTIDDLIKEEMID